MGFTIQLWIGTLQLIASYNCSVKTTVSVVWCYSYSKLPMKNTLVNAMLSLALRVLVDSKSLFTQAHVVQSVWQQKMDFDSYYQSLKSP